ncbi:quinone oxidoreductase family protein [Gimibacter soli]|uniref:Quinone oxidoreductase n=1 Tax=Gimibacter soli TaxID=3024400 RepID=A0AAF0BLV0_9PROT|nr:quinone oxidoreductase [Gimibacter soli]WCL54587.1 quinone oxidoreductase [Gimibacter soli]
MTTARVIRFEKTGGPEVLASATLDIAAPGAGEVLIRQEAIGLDFIDTYHRSGLYPVPLPAVPGLEAAGVIEAVGAGVTEFREGDRVAYPSGPMGAYASHRLFPVARLVKLPDGVDFEAAAALMLKAATVECLIRRTFRVEAGQTVLFHAAAGGVGLIACQWLKALGANIIGTVGSEEKAEIARAHGCTHTINYNTEDFVARVREITDGKGVPVVYDGVGKDTFMGSLDCLSRRGMMVSFGNATGPVAPFSPAILAQKGSLFLTRPTMMDYVATREDLELSTNAIFDAIKAGHITASVRQRFALEDAPEAHRALESRATTGQTILIP